MGHRLTRNRAVLQDLHASYKTFKGERFGLDLGEMVSDVRDELESFVRPIRALNDHRNAALLVE